MTTKSMNSLLLGRWWPVEGPFGRCRCAKSCTSLVRDLVMNTEALYNGEMGPGWDKHEQTIYQLVRLACIHEHFAIHTACWNIILALTTVIEDVLRMQPARDPYGPLEPPWVDPREPPGVFEEGWARTAEPEPDSSQFLHVTGLLQGIEDSLGSCWPRGHSKTASGSSELDWPRLQRKRREIPRTSIEKSPRIEADFVSVFLHSSAILPLLNLPLGEYWEILGNYIPNSRPKWWAMMGHGFWVYIFPVTDLLNTSANPLVI